MIKVLYHKKLKAGFEGITIDRESKKAVGPIITETIDGVPVSKSHFNPDKDDEDEWEEGPDGKKQ